MCGLVGIYTAELNKHLPQTKCLFGEMLFADTVRGEDATGFALVSDKKKGNGKHIQIYKKAMAGYDFLQLKGTKKIIGEARDTHLFMGHNRKGTKGGITDATSHPFQHGNITLCHNGTIHNHSAQTGGSKFDVDSEWLAWNIAEEGIEETIKKITGSFALTYYDSSNKTFNIIRNSQRTLFWCPIEDSDTIVYASEENLLRWTIERNKLEIVGGDKEIFSFKENHLYQFELGSTEYTEERLDTYSYRTYPQYKNEYWNRPSTRYTPASREELETTIKAQGELTKLIGKSIAFKYISSVEMSDKDQKSTKMRVIVKGVPSELSAKSWFPTVHKLGYKYRIITKSSAVPAVISAYKDNLWRGAVCGYSLHNEAREVIVFLEDTKPTTTAAQVTDEKSRRIVDKVKEEMEDISTSGKKEEKKNLPVVVRPKLAIVSEERMKHTIKGRDGIYVPANIYFEQIARGCLCCNEAFDEHDANTIVWTVQGDPICDCCHDLYGKAGMPFIFQ